MIKPRILWGTLALIFSFSLPVNAQNCTPLAVVKGEGTSVTKRVSPPNAGILPFVPVGFRGNWDTDFAISGNASYRYFIGTIQSASEDPAPFKIQMFLKYSDGTADRVFDETVRLEPNESQQMTGRPRPGDLPFQVNLNVGGKNAIGHSYTIQVEGCQ
ncbi:hypothetical protein [Lyngbya sp. PCC 8106]|uniref:hypothetical protein n=1 Tax=Lyngbya sp. (strain PCC 8106) TaxID=313612 RepID=UPI0000EAC40C|nr:hypothetical protein [Lyngbya sp. PCC 8106]EAW38475.1 hypothetical protein L8106_06729 [Lyngbya sp. PCC 8106]